jgi:hypothetical protein
MKMFFVCPFSGKQNKQKKTQRKMARKKKRIRMKEKKGRQQRIGKNDVAIVSAQTTAALLIICHEPEEKPERLIEGWMKELTIQLYWPEGVESPTV